MSLSDWTEATFSYDAVTHPTFRRGTGPGVVVVHEIPGITPKVLSFAEEVVESGFTVVMPSLVGTPGKAPSGFYGLSSMVKVCVSREFTTWAVGRTSPVTRWLRALARDLHEELGGPGVGALGMCFSGGFALAMMVDEHTVAPVLSQPSLPFAMGKRRSADLNLTATEVDAVVARAQAGCGVVGLRFTGDKLVGTRFDTLRGLLGDRFEAVEFPSAAKRDHSVVSEQRQQAAVDRVLAFFHERLDAGSASVEGDRGLS